MGTDRVCGMDEFRVEVVNVAEEAERLKVAAKAATAKDKDGDEGKEEEVPTIPCDVQVKTRSFSTSLTCILANFAPSSQGRVSAPNYNGPS